MLQLYLALKGLFTHSNFFVLLVGLVVGLLIISFYYLEKRAISIEEMVLVAMLSAISTIGRVIFSSIPSVQPSSFIIIISGIAFGPTIGLFVGIITAFTSNLILGQGPWTIWQMFFWGCMGLLAGLFRQILLKNKVILALYGFIWGFLFGWGMNLWFVLGYSETGFGIFLVFAITSFPMDLAHAICNCLLLLIAGKSSLKRLMRIGVKYAIAKPLS